MSTPPNHPQHPFSRCSPIPYAALALWAGLLASANAGTGADAAQPPKKPAPTAPATVTAPPSEANPKQPAPGHSLHDETFNEGPRQHAVPMPGMGRISFPVTAKNQAANVQSLINQGVAQLHTFFYFEAERSFREAALADPNCAMAYWGMAMANANNEKRAKGFLAMARDPKRQKGLTRRELLYIEALSAFYPEAADKKNDKARYTGIIDKLETIVQEFPDDMNAKAWLAMYTWRGEGSNGIGSRQAVDSVIADILRSEPMHPGAHHYRVHLWDGKKPERALSSAAQYAASAPGIAHAWHMPGHTYDGLKRYHDAAYQQEGSARVDHDYMIRHRVMPFQIHNYAHNNQWLCTNLSHIGRVRDALAVARDLVEQPRDPVLNKPEDGGSSQRAGRKRWSEILARYELWDALLSAQNSGALDWSRLPEERIEGIYLQGLAYANQGNAVGLAVCVARLRDERERTQREIARDAAKPKDAKDVKDAKPKDAKDVKDAKPKDAKDAKPPKDVKDPLGPRASEDIVNSALAELEGHQYFTVGDKAKAWERWEKASRMRTEVKARLALKLGKSDLAESLALQAVEQGRNQIPPLAAKVEILHALGKDDLAQKAYQELVVLARNADRDLPVMQRIALIAQSRQWKAPETSPEPPYSPSRIDLTQLGPIAWRPWPAPPLTLADTDGKTWSLEQQRGRNVLVLFFLGGSCAHCMEQLQAFGKEIKAFQALNTTLVAVSTDSREATLSLKNNPDGVRFPMPLLADPDHAFFRTFHAYDDFENLPLHGAFLIDAAGNVRFQNISANPFMDAAFLLSEVERVNKLLKRSETPTTAAIP